MHTEKLNINRDIKISIIITCISEVETVSCIAQIVLWLDIMKTIMNINKTYMAEIG
jgi:hypothetical protein